MGTSRKYPKFSSKLTQQNVKLIFVQSAQSASVSPEISKYTDWNVCSWKGFRLDHSFNCSIHNHLFSHSSDLEGSRNWIKAFTHRSISFQCSVQNYLLLDHLLTVQSFNCTVELCTQSALNNLIGPLHCSQKA